MEKEFNITGNCRPAKHYMADVSGKLAKTLNLVEKGKYFMINRPRQYGKTTTLHTIVDTLKKREDYVVFSISFGGVGDAIFDNEIVFSEGFVNVLARYAQYQISDLAPWLRETARTTKSLDDLSQVITRLVLKCDKNVVLLIDEVDKSSNNQLFISFLAMLREKYLLQDSVKTFHSIVLAGVHDVKSLKLKIRAGEEAKLNSPWNIAAEFTVDMNLQPFEIKPMLDEYVADKGVKMDTQKIADRLFYYTSGYPFLVSKLCKMLDENSVPTKTSDEWVDDDLETAVRLLVKENNTNFESLVKNLENNEDLYDLVYKIVIDSMSLSFNIHNSTINFGALYGIFVNKNGFIAIHNRIYNEVITSYMADNMHILQLRRGADFGYGYKNDDNTLNMEAVLLGFQAFMKKEYSKKDRDFLEKNGRLVFLAFIKPIINGSGYDFKEPQISEEKRLDVVLTYFQHKYVAELKIWRGQKEHEKGLAQLSDYLDRQALTEGYLLIFDHSEVKKWDSGWIETPTKKIFSVWV
ncbi:MAG: AAA-like domain-containing protein [Saprospiraceae bacterium]|nr:AAA-like domain-containing protein [Saprospiraceae bacterium]